MPNALHKQGKYRVYLRDGRFTVKENGFILENVKPVSLADAIETVADLCRCRVCGGGGKTKCQVCVGVGRRRVLANPTNPRSATIIIICNACLGSGRVNCRRCKGTGDEPI